MTLVKTPSDWEGGAYYIWRVKIKYNTNKLYDSRTLTLNMMPRKRQSNKGPQRSQSLNHEGWLNDNPLHIRLRRQT